jgi:SAM-dependent methyltransferase
MSQPADDAASTLRRLARPLRSAAREVGHRVEERTNPATGWLRSAAREHPSPPDLWDRVKENRRRLVEELAPGRSFLDVGGMYGIAGEIAFMAERAGATKVTLMDGMDPSDDFIAKHEANSSNVEFVQGDVHDAELFAWIGEFDVIWCTGVIYHSPNPMQQLRVLRSITTGTLVVGTHVIPEVPGIEQLCMLYPGVSEETQQMFADILGGPERFPGMASPYDESPLMVYANMWWGFSPSALRSMLRYSGLDVTAEHRYGPYWMDMVTKPGGVSMDMYPPDEQSRERVLARHAGVPDDELPLWARAQVQAIRTRP